MPGPLLSLVALLVIGLLGLALRWAFAVERDRDYGMLREVAKVPSQRAAEVVTGRLREVGVRVTTVRSPDGESLRIMVFPADERRAIDALLDDLS